VQPDFDRLAVQRVVHPVAGELRLASPDGQQLVVEMFAHLVAEHAVQVSQQLFLAGRVEHLQRLAVDLDHPDARHALGDELWMLGQVRGQVRHPARPQLVEVVFQIAVVFFPQRDGGIFK
jgi:hypothetical protein